MRDIPKMRARLAKALRRPVALLAAAVLALGGWIGPIGAGLAYAEAATLRVTAMGDNASGHPQGSNMRVDTGTGGVAYCGQGYLRLPDVGDTLRRYGSLGIPELDYVMFHGYDGEVVTSVYGQSAAVSEAATAGAVWLAIGEKRGDVLNFTDSTGTHHGNQYYQERVDGVPGGNPGIPEPARSFAKRLYADAVAYARRGGGGPEEGCATYWMNTGFDQGLVTCTKAVPVNFTKVSADPAITDGNVEYSLAGAEYDIFNARTNQLEAHIVLDENGRASYQLSPSEYYYAVETKAPRGYKLNPNRIEFQTGNSTSDEALADDPGTVRITVNKKDAATLGPAQGGASLEGAEFKAVDANGRTHTAKTNAKGVAYFIDIPFGKVTVTETKAPRGYKLDPTPHEYHISADQANAQGDFDLVPEDDFRENVVAFGIDIVKYKDSGDEGSGLQEPGAGVQFQVISNSTGKVVCTLTTDAYGKASTPMDAWYGDGERPAGVKGPIPYDAKGYTIREVASTTPEGYQPAPDWQVTPEQMADGATLHYIVDNDFVGTHLQVVKADAASGASVPLAGFTFQVLDKDKRPVTQESWYPNHVELTEFTTDESGRVTLPEELKPGTYYIRETAAQPPYLLNGEDLKITIPNKTDLAPVVIATFTDRQATGEATISKTCSDDGRPLAGAEYDVVTTHHVISPDGLVQAVEGEVVGHVTTGEDGRATVKGLPLGVGEATYAFVETAPPAGHVLDATPHEFTLTYEDQHTAVVTAEAAATDAPTHLIVEKAVEGTGEPLGGAVFALWDADDEAPAAKREADVLAVRAPEGKRLTAESVPSSITLTAEGDWRLTDGDGEAVEPTAVGTWTLEQGTYTARLERDGEKYEAKVKARLGKSYAIALDEGLFGPKVRVDEADAAVETELAWSGEDAAYVAEGLSGEQRILADGRTVATVDLEGDAYYELDGHELAELPCLLKDGAAPTELTTDDEGRIDVTHLESGTYRLREVAAPEGYLVEPGVTTIEISPDGMTEGEAVHTIRVEDAYTKVDIYKKSVTDESEVEGAKLTVLDSEGEVVDSWTSTAEPHRIERIEPGDYTLVEELEPRTYDKATAVDFTVEPTGEVQKVVMYDDPIKITAEIDKRQEIADPVADDTAENGDGLNRAEVTESDEGEYDYSVDFRNTSSTWVDEFTVTDEVDGAADGLATLGSITTPAAEGDYDGLMNVWYRSGKPELVKPAPPEDGEQADGQDGTPAPAQSDIPASGHGGTPTGDQTADPTANATLSDGHENPWLDDEQVAGALGGDSRAVDYEGWKLWREGVETDRATELDVAELDLPEGEVVTAVRLEYGRVEKGFTTRTGEWDREELKDAHDDLADVKAAHEGDAFEAEATATLTMEDGTEVTLPMSELDGFESGAGWMLDLDEDGNPEFYAQDAAEIAEAVESERSPLIMHMAASIDYRPGTTLANRARVDAYRNGGGDKLEDHDEDAVAQTPKQLPIEITAEIDKRQEIADPTAKDTAENGDGLNRAEVTKSDKGEFDYSVDFRNTSSTWVDEFTVTDEIDGAEKGLAVLQGITTPAAEGDYDGLMNVWYRSAKPESAAEDEQENADSAQPEGGKPADEQNGTPAPAQTDIPASGHDDTPAEEQPAAPTANATLSDGHENPWLTDPHIVEKLGGDSRAVDYDGWRLWREGVPTERAVDLSAAELDLPEGEVVTAVRLEYGRVEKDFTTRTGEWDRKEIKDAHDDLDDAKASHEGDAFEAGGLAEIALDDGSVAVLPLGDIERSDDGKTWAADVDGDGEAETYDAGKVTVHEEGEVERSPLIAHMRVTDAYKPDTKLANRAQVDAYRNGGGEGLEDHDEDGVEQVPRHAAKPIPQTGTTQRRLLLAAVLALGAVLLLIAARALRPKTVSHTTDVFGNRI